jgi:hypothetical protein
MITGSRQAYPDLNITHWIYALKHHIVSHKYVQFCQFKINKIQKFIIAAKNTDVQKSRGKVTCAWRKYLLEAEFK